ncbi:MAG: bacterial Ig-like domain-containing protein, partial [Clostridia bacterium]|nr:bacterial Ig-like domain-containing protein [Clostridia bacterium]
MKMKQKKKIAFLTLVIILINLFSPYSILLHKVNAASGTLPDPVVVFNKIQNITEKNGNKFFKVQVAVVGDINVKGLDLKLTYDNTKIQPAVKTTGASNTNIALTSETYPDMADGMYTIKTYDKTSEEYRVQYAKSGGHDLPDLCYSAGMGWDALYEDYDTWASGFDYYLPIITYTFRLVDTTLTDDDITTELFDLVPVTGSLPSGAQIVYENASGIDVAYDIPEIKGVGFATPTKTVSMIAIKNNPTNTTYDHGETIDLTGGMITVTYSDGSTEDISMEDSKIAIKSGSPADVNNPSVTIDYGGKQTSFNITVNDPVKSLTVATPMSDVEYNQNESFDFSSLVLTATKKSGATQSLTTSSSGVQVSENTADVNSPNFTQASASGVVPISGTQKIVFTYEGKTATQTVLVNDTIASVDVISQPTKTVYKRGESLELAGAVVKLTLGSGATANINLPDGSVSVSSYSNTTTGRKQNLTVSVAGINATQTIDVEAYNYITGSTLTAPTKSSYQYKEELNLAGGQLKFNWHDGNITTISLTDDMVSGYNKTTLGTQTINVNYTATYTLSDSSIITDAITDTFDVFVIDTVTGITVTAPTKDTYYHGDSLNLAGGTITVNYASGASTNVTMTESMIKESDGSAVNMSPASSEYAANHTLAKTLKIEYTEGGETGSTNYPITIIDKVVSVAIHTTPKTNYNVNETLDLTNGEIAVTRASTTTQEIISMSNANVTVEGFASNVEASNLPLTVKYTENGITESTSYNVNVTDTVTSVSVSNAPTTVKVGEELDLSGMTITVTKGSGTTTVPVSSATITGYDKNTLGPQTVTVSYGGQSDTFNVTVQDYVTGITVNPSSVTGNYNDELSSIINNNNITYTVTYASAGAKSPVALAESMVTGYSKTTTSAQNLTVTYTDND